MSDNNNPTDTFRFWAECGVCKKDGFFRRKHEHMTPLGVKVYSRSFMCSGCRAKIEKQLVASEKRVIE